MGFILALSTAWSWKVSPALIWERVCLLTIQLVNKSSSLPPLLWVTCWLKVECKPHNFRAFLIYSSWLKSPVTIMFAWGSNCKVAKTYSKIFSIIFSFRFSCSFFYVGMYIPIMWKLTSLKLISIATRCCSRMWRMCDFVDRFT